MQLSSDPVSNPGIVSPASTHLTVVLSVRGMNMNGLKAVTELLLQQPGVISAVVDLVTGTATVNGKTEIDPAALANTLTQAGFPSQPQSEIKPEPLKPKALIGFYIVAVIFNLCLMAQVLTVGLAYFYNPEWWNIHVWLVRGYGSLSLILLGGAYWVPVPRRVRSLAASLPVLLGLQFLTIHLNAPIPLSILHPLIGFTLFSSSTTLVHRVWRIISPKPEEETAG
ncbi:cation transporter [Leptolyngbya sp. FACHB-36]|nr:DUF6220 domain-containing protein [Leptolyngbya sp. FACHB-36]MBD2018807.1 cation transporter [Leptolyngbya sp. FACHB-36]